MIPIGKDALRDSASLRTALAEALSPLGIGGDPVTLEGEFPAVARLAVNMDGAKFTRDLRVAAVEDGAGAEGGFFARALEVNARRATFDGAEFQAALRADDVVFGFVRGADGGLVMRLERAAGGTLEMSVARTELEHAIRRLAAEAAEKQGAEIKSVAIEMTAEGTRILAVRVAVTAKAMMFTAAATVTGRVEISTSLEARVRDLACHGDGMLGNLAAGFLRPRFAEIEARMFPLGRALGGVAVRDVEISGGDRLRIRATFGSA